MRGINVYDYDKDVLKRRITGRQVIIAIASSTVPVLLFVGMVTKFILLLSDTAKLLGITGFSITMVVIYNTAFGDRIAEKLGDFGMWVAGITPLR